MRHGIVFLTACLLALPLAAQQVYQLPNGGFEEWDDGITSEPTHWNSFATSDGTFASLASTPHHYRRDGGRPGTTGNHYLTIYTKSVAGIKANGNMTTGRIHAGAVSASSAQNYNYTQRSNDNFCQRFTGTPDSMYIWVSFYANSATSQAQVSAIIHGDNDFRAPNDEQSTNLYCGRAKALFTPTTTSASSMSWQQVKVPFEYSGTSEPRYLLITMATNDTPGSGAANDSLSVDDIVFIYSAWLDGIAVNGTPVADFERGRMDYTLGMDDADALDSASITYTTQAGDATATVSNERINDTMVVYTIEVVAEDGVTTQTYHVTLTTGAVPVGIDNPLAESPLRLFPNPTGGQATLVAQGLATLYDSKGAIVWSQYCSGATTIDLTPLKAGIYLLRCGSQTEKVVKY